MTHPAKISGVYLLPLFQALGVSYKDVTRTVIDPPGVITVTYALRDENGARYRAGDGIAKADVRVHIDWPPEPE